MPTPAFFAEVPPFPADLPTAQLPVISHSKLAANSSNEEEALWQAGIDHGFFLLDLSDSEADEQLCEDIVKVFRLGREFFDLPLETKTNFKRDHRSVGYKPIGVLKHADGRSDLTEICAVSRDSALGVEDSEIPDVFAQKRELLASVVERLHQISRVIMKILADRFSIPVQEIERLHNLSKSSGSVLRFLHNPPQPAEEAMRQTSLMGHTDSGSITILFPQLGGLQLLPADMEDVEENWQWVKPQPGCAVINLGDALVQWTGGVLRSSFHRVMYAPGLQSSSQRYSFGYFLKPAGDAPMRRLQYGNLIPRLTAEDDEVEWPGYDDWHHQKLKGLYKGENRVMRGGVTPKPAQSSATATSQVKVSS